MLQSSHHEGSLPGRRFARMAGLLSVAVAGGVVLASFLRPSATPPAPGASSHTREETVLARVGDTSITQSDLLAAWAKRPPFSTAEPSQHAAVVLEDLIRRELYFAEAVRTRFTEREDVRAAWKRWMIQRFREEVDSSLAASEGVEEAAVEAYLREHAAQFTAPERRRLALIRLGPAPVTGAERREELEQTIAGVRELAVPQAATVRDFGDLAGIHSSHLASRRSGGDVGWLTRAQAARIWPVPVVEAAFSLRAPGAISPVIPTDEGWFLLKLVERQEGRVASLDSVRERIRREIAQSRKAAAETALLHELRARHGVQIHSERLAAMEIPRASHPPEPSLVQRPPSMPAP